MNIYGMISSFKQFVLERYTDRDVKTLKGFMNKKKVEHSCNVALLLRKLYYTKDTYNAALYHDFIERGGTETELRGAIGNYATELVLAVSITDEDESNFDSDNLTLDLLKRKIHKYPEKMMNEIIRIKICDRIDNLRKRRKEGKKVEVPKKNGGTKKAVVKGIVGKKYELKSAQLLEFLYNEYSGANKPDLKAFIIKKVLSKHPDMVINFGDEPRLVDDAAVNQVAA